MNIPLPAVRDNMILSLPHFPAMFQCVIFRNWGIVPAERIAQVIGTDSDVVRACAADMGLCPNAEASPDWLVKGYITIIRANWHILTYDALCELLDWTTEKLAFILREDDFLDQKLGGFKPAVVDFKYRPLTDLELRRTAEIRKIITEATDKLPPVTVQPFDFAPMFRLHSRDKSDARDARFEERYVYSYCALYGDTFANRDLIDASFPDELLEAYAGVGITGVWTHIILYTVVKFPFAAELSEGYETRQDGMRYLTEKLARYGLKLFLYFNEPRAMPIQFFDNAPELLGVRSGEYGTLCVSHPRVQEYLRGGAAELAEKIPLLGGFFTITASENLTNCYSHSGGGTTPCPRCSKHTAAEIFATVSRLVYEGVSSAGVDSQAKPKVIAWNWGWLPDYMPDVVKNLPEGVSLMSVSEQGVTKRISGVETSVLDYSISIEGPGEYALSTFETARRAGHSAYAKMQVNNSWEIAAVPYIPVFEKIYRHIKSLTESGSRAPNGLMLSWSLGGYPSPTLALLAEFYNGGSPVPTLRELYAKMFGIADAALLDLLESAFHLFSEAFDEYPFHISVAYNAPQHYAPANLLHEKPTGFSATMVGYPYDDLRSWSAVFPIETYVSQIKKVSDGWERGLSILRQAAAGTAQFQELLDCAEICGCHFRSIYLQCSFIALRDAIPLSAAADLTVSEILREEEAISLRTAAIAAHNPTIAYESSNHYFYTRASLLEKILSCRYLGERGDGETRFSEEKLCKRL